MGGVSDFCVFYCEPFFKIEEGVMKKLIALMFGLVMVFSIASAYADDASMNSQTVQEQSAVRDHKANFSYWFPIVPESRANKWTNIVVVSNFNTDPITVTCWFTKFARNQRIETYDLEKYEKWFIYLADFGDDLYDVYCECDQYFGAAALLVEDGKIVTAWPPIY
jgi:hypothetical protein